MFCESRVVWSLGYLFVCDADKVLENMRKKVELTLFSGCLICRDKLFIDMSQREE